MKNPRSKAGSSPFLETLTSDVFAGKNPLWLGSLWRPSRITFLCVLPLHLLVWPDTAMARQSWWPQWQLFLFIVDICCKSQGNSKAFGSSSIPGYCYDYTYLPFNLYGEKGFQAFFLRGRPGLAHDYCSHRQSKKVSSCHPHARGHQKLMSSCSELFSGSLATAVWDINH